MTKRDVKRLSEIMYMIGQIEGYADQDWVSNHCDTIQEYIEGLFVSKHFEQDETIQRWIPLAHDEMTTDFPYEHDGEWVVVTDGKSISVERIKKDAYDHFFPNGRWFELDDAIAWMPLPMPFTGGDSE